MGGHQGPQQGFRHAGNGLVRSRRPWASSSHVPSEGSQQLIKLSMLQHWNELMHLCAAWPYVV